MQKKPNIGSLAIPCQGWFNSSATLRDSLWFQKSSISVFILVILSTACSAIDFSSYVHLRAQQKQACIQRTAQCCAYTRQATYAVIWAGCLWVNPQVTLAATAMLYIRRKICDSAIT